MAIVQGKSEVKKEEVRPDRLDEKLMKPGKYEVSREDTFTVEIWLKKNDRRWVLCGSSEKNSMKEEVVFRMWTYDEMVDLRKKATTYDPLKRIHMVDHDALNRMKLQSLMVSWTFDKDNPRLRLQHINGVLTDESWGAFTKLSPNICSYIIERMNLVYEFNS
jgi:hypothetical protein